MKNRRSGKGFSPRRGGAKLGQHFLTGLWAAHRLAGAVQLARGETILEIGPGKGALTRELLTRGRVIAIEKDPNLVEGLQETFADELRSGALTIIAEDVRNSSPDVLGLTQYVVAANIPYYITGEIIRQFLTATIQPRAMALLVQKEVADRILARDKKESILSLSVKVFGTPRIVAKVTRGNFSPRPNVDSAILLIDAISKKRFTDLDEASFFKVIRAGFSSKRKFMVSNLGAMFGKATAIAACASCSIPEKSRAEDVALEQWLNLARYINHTSG